RNAGDRRWSGAGRGGAPPGTTQAAFMTPFVIVLVAVFGAAGTVCRYWLDRLVLAHTRSSVPLGTALVNVTGSLLLGLLSGFVASGLLPESVALAIGGGFVGGYTTFSTAMFETVMLLR